MMLAYASNSRPVAGREGSSRALSLIIAGHVAVIAAVMTAKMDIVGPTLSAIPTIIDIPASPPPPPPETQPPPEKAPASPAHQQTFIDVPPNIVDMGPASTQTVELGPIIADRLPPVGPPSGLKPAKAVPVRIAAIPRTPESALRPPYPNDKLREQEEATLRLRLEIDPRGRVTAVIPIGPADPSFLAAARRHIIRAWRYQPATEDGVAIASSLEISLSFRLEEA